MIARPLWPASTPLELRTVLDLLVTSLMAHTNKAYNLPTYADNTAAKAAGLTDGVMYRTSTGVVMVVYT